MNGFHFVSHDHLAMSNAIGVRHPPMSETPIPHHAHTALVPGPVIGSLVGAGKRHLCRQQQHLML